MGEERAAANDGAVKPGEDLQRLLDELESERQEARERVIEANRRLARIADER